MALERPVGESKVYTACHLGMRLLSLRQMTEFSAIASGAAAYTWLRLFLCPFCYCADCPTCCIPAEEGDYYGST